MKHASLSASQNSLSPFKKAILLYVLACLSSCFMLDKKKWLIEVLWLLFTVVVVLLVLWPIRLQIYQFPFERSNIYFIVIFITGLRWLLFLPSTLFAKNMWVKLVLIFLSIWIAIYSMNRFAEFQVFIDEKGVESISNHLGEQDQIAMGKYISSEFIFFAVGAILVCLLLPFKMVISLWRTYNLNKA